MKWNNFTFDYFLIFLIFKDTCDIAENGKENNPKKTVCIVEDSLFNYIFIFKNVANWKEGKTKKKRRIERQD
jgi:hypothetical protein